MQDPWPCHVWKSLCSMSTPPGWTKHETCSRFVATSVSSKGSKMESDIVCFHTVLMSCFFLLIRLSQMMKVDICRSKKKKNNKAKSVQDVYKIIIIKKDQKQNPRLHESIGEQHLLPSDSSWRSPYTIVFTITQPIRWINIKSSGFVYSSVKGSACFLFLLQFLHRLFIKSYIPSPTNLNLRKQNVQGRFSYF